MDTLGIFYHPIAVLPMMFERVIYTISFNLIYIPSCQFGFIKGTGAQDYATATALTTIAKLYILGHMHLWGIGGVACLTHLRSIGMRSKVYLCSYLSDSSLLVVANGNTPSCRKFTADVRQGQGGLVYPSPQ